MCIRDSLPGVTATSARARSSTRRATGQPSSRRTRATSGGARVRPNRPRTTSSGRTATTPVPPLRRRPPPQGLPLGPSRGQAGAG
eukprot:9301412-Alexandrium_andersonii.AAC.1